MPASAIEEHADDRIADGQEGPRVVRRHGVEEAVLTMGDGPRLVTHLGQRIGKAVEARQHLVELARSLRVAQPEWAECCHEPMPSS